MANERLSAAELAHRRAVQVAAAQVLLRREVEALRSGDDWRQFLALQAKLHTYSPRNVLLIRYAHNVAFAEGRVPQPDNPGFVAGFNTWRALGRTVDKGQHGYPILVPLRRTERVGANERGQERRLDVGEQPRAGEVEGTFQRITGFKVEYVFSQWQTSGAPLPELPQPRLLRGEAPAGLGEAVIQLVESKDYYVDTAPNAAALDGANGCTFFGLKHVLVREDMDDAAMCTTLIQEAAHIMLHEQSPGRELPRPRHEVEAESVAFVVSAAHGMPTDDFSFPCVAGWLAQVEDPSREIAATQDRVARAASEILAVSPAEHVTGGRVPGVERAIRAAREAREARQACEAAELDRSPGPRPSTEMA